MASSRAGLLVVTAAAFVALWTAAAFLDVADLLTRDVERVLREAQDRDYPTVNEVATVHPEGGMTFTTVHPPLDDVERGMQLALITLFFGGIPAAVTALGVAAVSERRRCQWSAGWSGALQAGFIFQVGSLVVTLPIFSAYAIGGLLHGSTPDVVGRGAFVGSTLVASLLAIPYWLALRNAAVQQPIRITGTVASVGAPSD
jgi:hypothetical protein